MTLIFFLNFVHNNVMCPRGNFFKLYKKSFGLDGRKDLFTSRMINVWNSLHNVLCVVAYYGFNKELKSSKHC